MMRLPIRVVVGKWWYKNLEADARIYIANNDEYSYWCTIKTMEKQKNKVKIPVE